MLENLRNKSENYKRGVAFGTAFFVTLLIFGVWVTALFPNFIGGSSVVASKTNAEQPVATFGRNVASTFSAFKVQFGSFADYFKEVKYENQNEIKVFSPDGRDTQIQPASDSQNTY